MRDPARQLVRVTGRFAVTPRLPPEMRPGIVELFDLAVLSLQGTVVDRPTVDSGRGPGLEPRYAQADLLQLFSEVCRCRLARATARHLGPGANVNAAAQEGPCCDNDGASAEPSALQCLDAKNGRIV